MNAYTISKLARDSGFSVAVVHNYTQRGLLRPARNTAAGYRIYDREALERLRLIQAGRRAGIPMAEVQAICRALNRHDGEHLARDIATARSRVTEARAALDAFDGILAALDRLALVSGREKRSKVHGGVVTTHAG